MMASMICSYFVLLVTIALSQQYETILAANTACFDAKYYNKSTTFNAPINGTINGIILSHINGSVSCNGCDENGPESNPIYTNWGCQGNVTASSKFFVMLMHITGSDYYGTTYYPTLSTQGVSIQNGAAYNYSKCDRGCHVQNSGTYNLYGYTVYSTNITFIDLAYNVTTNDQFTLQYSEACCTDFLPQKNHAFGVAYDNCGSACTSVYFLYPATNAPTTEPTAEPTDQPTYSPNVWPSKSVRCSKETAACEVIAFSLNISSNDAEKLYHFIMQNITTFEAIIQQNIYNDFKKYSGVDIYVGAIFYDDSIYTTANITNFNLQIHNEDLTSYVNSPEASASISADIMRKYKIQNKIHATAIRILNYFPQPPDWNTFDLNKPVPKILLAVFIAFMVLLFCGYCHGSNARSFSKCGCPLSDNFLPGRLISFVSSSFVAFWSITTTYGYLWSCKEHNWDWLFLYLGLGLLLLILLQIMINCCLLYKLDKNEYVRNWFRTYGFLLVMLIIICNSYYSALSFVNCNLFGFRICSMRLSNKQLNKLSIKPWSLMLISLNKLTIHGYVTYYIFSKGYNDYGNQIGYLSILSTLFCLLSLLTQVIYKYTSFYPKYECVNISVKIEIEQKYVDDIRMLQKQKRLVNRIKKLLAQILESHPNQVEILSADKITNGIEICVVIYYEKKHKPKLSMSRMRTLSKRLSDAMSASLRKSLLNNNHEKDGLIENQTDIQQTLTEASILKDLQYLYALQTEPSNVSFDIDEEDLDDNKL